MDQATQAEAQASSTTSGTRGSSVLNQGLGGILGIKAGMTQVYNENGDLFAVTVIDLQPTVVTQVRTKEKDGYQAVQLAILEKKAKSCEQARARATLKSGAAGFYHYEEIRLAEKDKLDGLVVGNVLSPEFVKEGDCVTSRQSARAKASKAA